MNQQQHKNAQKPISIKSTLFQHTLIITIITTLQNLLVLRFSPHSFENQLLPAHPFFSRMANFDGIQFLTNSYEYEQNYVFLPGFTEWIQIINFLCNYEVSYSILLVTLINRILIYFTALELYKIAQFYSLSSQQLQFISILFIYNPAAIFYHSLYSESIYAFLIFKAIRLYLQKGNWITFTLMISLCTIFRSTAIFMLPVIGLEILADFVAGGRKGDVLRVFRKGVQGLFVIIAVMLPFISYLMWGYWKLCQTIQQTENCQHFINIYSYIQAKYWNVGFFKYFSMNNILFILIGTPSIIFSLFTFKIHHKQHLLKLGLDLSWLILILTTVTMTNIQSSTRFFSTHPLFYVNIGQFLLKKQGVMKKTVLSWWCFYCVFGGFMFYLGFPWT